jgi:hypothetical protein
LGLLIEKIGPCFMKVPVIRGFRSGATRADQRGAWPAFPILAGTACHIGMAINL